MVKTSATGSCQSIAPATGQVWVDGPLIYEPCQQLGTVNVKTCGPFIQQSFIEFGVNDLGDVKAAAAVGGVFLVRAGASHLWSFGYPEHT